MLVLNSVNDRIQAVLESAGTSIRFNVSYKDLFAQNEAGYGDQVTLSTGTDLVTILDPPSVFGGQSPRAGVIRQTETMQIHNGDTIEHEITVYYNRAGTLYIIFRIRLPAGYSATFPTNGPPQALTADGDILIGTSTPTDACDDDTAWLFHFNTDGFDTKTVYKWLGSGGFDITVNTSIFKFGPGSAPADNLFTPTDFDLSTFFDASWTVEFFGRMALNGTIEFVEAGGSLDFGFQASSTNNAFWFVVDDVGGTIVSDFSIPVAISVDTWYHIAVVRDHIAGTYSLYFNGNRLDTVSSAATVPEPGPNPTGDRFNSSANSYVDELRYSTVARYSGTTYTIPTAAFTEACSTGTWGVIFGNWLGLTGMHNTNSPLDSNFHWSEVGLYVDTTRQNESITPTTPNIIDAGTHANLVDANLTTTALQISSNASHNNNRYYMGFNFGTPRTDINAVRFGAAGDPARCTQQCDVAQSTDGLNWAYVDTGITCSIPGAANTFGGFGSFSMQYPDAGQHIYWRIADIDNVDLGGGNRPLWLSEIAIYLDAANITSLASKSTTMTFTSGSMADWFDGTTATGNQVAFANIGTVTFEFGSPTRVNGLQFGGTAGLEANINYIHRCSLQYSDNGTDWTDAGRIAATTYPGDATLSSVIRLY